MFDGVVKQCAGLRIGGLVGVAKSRSAIGALSIRSAQDLSDQAHRRFARRTAQRRPKFLFALRDEHAQDQLHERQSRFGFAVQEPIVAHAAQTGGQQGIEQVPALNLAPLFAFAVDAAAGYDDVHVRVQIESTVVRVQHRALAEFGVQFALAEAFEGLGGGAEQG